MLLYAAGPYKNIRAACRRAEEYAAQSQRSHLLTEVEQEGRPAAVRLCRQDRHHLGRPHRPGQAAV